MYGTDWIKDYSQHEDEYHKIFHDYMSTQKPGMDITYLENALAEMHGREHCIMTSSGTDAVFFAVQSVVDDDAEVIVPSFSWISSASCAARANATAVFVDAEIDTYHMSIDSIQNMLSSSTQALVYPQLFGNTSELQELQELCDDHGIYLIEDACQALGSRHNKTYAGSYGEISTLSFNSNKTIAGVAGGGAVMTDDKDIAKEIRKLRVTYNGDVLGYNSEMHALNAAIIYNRLQRLEQIKFVRQEIAKVYNNGFRDLDYVHIQNDIDVDHTYHKYVIRFDDIAMRDRIAERLKAPIHYPKPLYLDGMWKHHDYDMDDCPNTELICDTVLTLPLHNDLSIGTVQMIVNCIWDICNEVY